METDHIGRLPAELKCAVVRYLVLKDRQAVSLINSDWAVVAMPIMWETFTTDLLVKTGPGSRNVRGLASPASNIVKHVRKVNLLDRPNAFKEADQLPQLLAAIPRGQLCGFKSGSGVPISLHIGALILPATFGTMFQRIDIIALTELVLDGTALVAGLLEAMGSDFQKREPSLRKLRLLLMDEDESNDIRSQLELFLLSFHGLSQLHYQCGNCDKIDVDGIINHGETLTDLLIVNGGVHRQDATECMSAEDLGKVAIACPSLEQLCLNLYEIDPDTPEGDFLGPKTSVPLESTEFEKALSAIASMKALRLLRLTNLPNYRKAYHRQGEFMRFFRRSLESGEQRYAFQARAGEISHI
ncbi:uncharacterized protein J4E88_009470 [Alternaria novae-zelandiae]|uniref:uncharacterized protein n=1 Tax=Alternaria novae-zelandiae TaxID=430562 RepID=UPI0020C2458D|nr:uncharacterized protein J4E88_009470 [Alternaria novae-zelandiae]KAI4671073.1 hypothetical protein J4E88_009470 [Alternaria novae-zelandiae]